MGPQKTKKKYRKNTKIVIFGPLLYFFGIFCRIFGAPPWLGGGGGLYFFVFFSYFGVSGVFGLFAGPAGSSFFLSFFLFSLSLSISLKLSLSQPLPLSLSLSTFGPHAWLIQPLLRKNTFIDDMRIHSRFAVAGQICKSVSIFLPRGSCGTWHCACRPCLSGPLFAISSFSRSSSILACCVSTFTTSHRQHSGCQKRGVAVTTETRELKFSPKFSDRIFFWTPWGHGRPRHGRPHRNACFPGFRGFDRSLCPRTSAGISAWTSAGYPAPKLTLWAASSSLHSRRSRQNCQNRQNRCLFVLHFVAQAKGGQGAFQNRQNSHEGYPP